MKLKTKYSSYNLNSLPEGCKYCVRGEKLVLFISGKCSRACWYCSLSKKRKNKDIIWANERKIKNTKQLIQEVKESNATSAGITGGDPILVISRTLSFAKALKKHFGKKFHIHIYLPTKLITKNKLKWLSRYIDEVRFHPEFLINTKSREDASQKPLGVWDKDIDKIRLAGLFWKKQNIGIELPMIPNKKQEILDFIIKISPHIGFVNLNEFELSETNSNIITKKYRLNEGGYTVKDSIKSGLWLLKEIKKRKETNKLRVHLCTAELKNNHQFRNRLKKHKTLPFGKRTDEGLVKYLIIQFNNKNKFRKAAKSLNKKNLKSFFIDNKKNRIILSENLARKLLKDKIKDYKIFLVEEFPTYDRIETEKQELG